MSGSVFTCDKCGKAIDDGDMVTEKEHGMSGTETWHYHGECAPEQFCNCSLCKQGLAHHSARP